MVRGPEVFSEVVRPIHCTWRPPYAELSLLDMVTNPIESHIYCFRPFLLDCSIGYARGARVVGCDWSGWLGVAEFGMLRMGVAVCAL